MTTVVAEIGTAAYAVSSVAHAVLAGYLGWMGRSIVKGRWSWNLMVGALAATAAWAASAAIAIEYQPIAWPIAAALLDLLRYTLWFGLLLDCVAPWRQAAGPRRLSPLWLVSGACLLLTALAQLWQIGNGEIGRPPARPILAMLIAAPVFGLLLLEQLFRNLSEDSRWNAKPICLALLCIFAFDIYMYSEGLMFGGTTTDTESARGLVHLLALPFLLMGARRRSGWLDSLHLSRTAAFYSATLILAGGYLLFISAVGYYVRYFGGDWGRALQISLMFAAAAFLGALIVSGSLRAWLKVFVGKHFFSYRFDYRTEWLRFTATLSSQGSPREVGLMVVRGLADMVESPAGTLWTRSGDGSEFRAVAQWNTGIVVEGEPTGSSLCNFLRSRQWVVDLDQFRDSPRSYEGLVLPTWVLAAPNAWLVVPLLVSDDLLGFVVLSRPRARLDVDWEVLDLLKTASRQAAGHLAQMQATEALLEARKFEAFNRMSAFVVHDLKNIVTQLSLMLRNAERLHDNREFQQDMLLTVASSLEKMRRLMLQLREGAAPPGGTRGVELASIVASLEAMARAQNRTLESRIGEKLATRGHADRLERVLGHLVQNALDATPDGGRVWLTVERHSGQVKIEVGDTGAGMTEEFVRSSLFKPFHTTKREGMGVGSYESLQYLRELGGSIEVDSRPGEGTRMTVLLPLFDMHSESDLLRAPA